MRVSINEPTYGKGWKRIDSTTNLGKALGIDSKIFGHGGKDFGTHLHVKDDVCWLSWVKIQPRLLDACFSRGWTVLAIPVSPVMAAIVRHYGWTDNGQFWSCTPGQWRANRLMMTHSYGE